MSSLTELHTATSYEESNVKNVPSWFDLEKNVQYFHWIYVFGYKDFELVFF